MDTGDESKGIGTRIKIKKGKLTRVREVDRMNLLVCGKDVLVLDLLMRDTSC